MLIEKWQFYLFGVLFFLFLFEKIFRAYNNVRATMYVINTGEEFYKKQGVDSKKYEKQPKRFFLMLSLFILELCFQMFEPIIQWNSLFSKAEDLKMPFTLSSLLNGEGKHNVE